MGFGDVRTWGSNSVYTGDYMSFYNLIEANMQEKFAQQHIDLWSARKVHDIHAVQRVVTLYMCARFLRQEVIELQEAA